ncbi:hypothetical protein IC229_11270 [Spirosoma sp. BT702]|uniref:Uncharacterized protein n=1 Tax=Spirosoma profusum TaxID=2771354 RepID=A0A927AN67_9BACT|nr:hypothetical protein [Spirosoma profusum]MBD2701219.1 hypothetical protein [Spirosoma profusum]
MTPIFQFRKNCKNSQTSPEMLTEFRLRQALAVGAALNKYPTRRLFLIRINPDLYAKTDL